MDTLVNIENVKGTHGNDIINGDGNANLLKGLDGMDVINGHAGDDTFVVGVSDTVTITEGTNGGMGILR